MGCGERMQGGQVVWGWENAVGLDVMWREERAVMEVEWGEDPVCKAQV